MWNFSSHIQLNISLVHHTLREIPYLCILKYYSLQYCEKKFYLGH